MAGCRPLCRMPWTFAMLGLRGRSPLGVRTQPGGTGGGWRITSAGLEQREVASDWSRDRATPGSPRGVGSPSLGCRRRHRSVLTGPPSAAQLWLKRGVGAADSSAHAHSGPGPAHRAGPAHRSARAARRAAARNRSSLVLEGGRTRTDCELVVNTVCLHPPNNARTGPTQRQGSVLQLSF